MSTENPTNNPEMMYTRNRRGSITQAALTNLFQRGNSVPNGSGFPNQMSSGSHPIDAGRRRLSVTTLGLSGTSPTNPQAYNLRRGSMSTTSNNSDSIDEYAIEEDDAVYGSSKTAPTTPFVRRMSFGTSSMRPTRPSGSPKNGNNPSSPPPSLQNGHSQSGQKVSRPRAPTQGTSISAALSAAGRRASTTTTLPASSPTQASSTRFARAPSDNQSSRPDQQGFNWSEQLRSRAESSVTGARPSFSLASGSPPRGNSIHDRAKSISEMPQPPVQAATVKQPRQERPKPDAFQERILKGDFYMD